MIGCFVGVMCTPKQVSTQLVSGANVTGVMLLYPPLNGVWEAIVEIYKPIDGQPHVFAIHKI